MMRKKGNTVVKNFRMSATQAQRLEKSRRRACERTGLEVNMTDHVMSILMRHCIEEEAEEQKMSGKAA